ncbi:unnamed protein product [Ilex paraguariensis]|uniref:HIT domain-containing protein n=1 Tax=Ilex paraguariensis TaxID=185542 RepID=A0ABC8R7B3_9AQUA
MEARRRLAVLSSHLRSITASTNSPKSYVLAANCASCSDVGKGTEEKNCVFCKIIRGEAKTSKLYEDDICLCILDTNPLTHGHSLIIPKCHFSSLDATPPSVVGAMCSKVPLIGNAVLKATGCDSFNLLVNNGAAAGQVIFHVSLL